jgi:hypothetical protein
MEFVLRITLCGVPGYGADVYSIPDGVRYVKFGPCLLLHVV